MMDDPHLGFIVAAYLAAICILIGLVYWIVTDFRLQKKALEELEAAGARRRSDGDLR